MSTHIVEITDDYGDTLTIEKAVGFSIDKLYVTATEEEALAQIELDRAAILEVRDALNNHLGLPVETDIESSSTANEAKLRLAVEWELRAQFAYQGDLDRKPVQRRLEPDSVYLNGGNLYVSGESYDAGGDPEGYRQFRLDRISGPVVVR